MTPETRAAHDELAAVLSAWDEHGYAPGIDTITSVRSRDGHCIPLHASSLRLVLAALDAQPAAILMSDAVLSETEYEDLKQRFTAAQHDAPRRTHSIYPAMGILSPTVAERAAEYHARRHTQNPDTSDESARDTP